MTQGRTTRDQRRILTLDLGNTSLKGVLWSGDRMRLSFRLRWGDEPHPDLMAEVGRVDEAAGVAVHGRDAAAPGWLPPIRWVGEDLPVPGEVLYDQPADMGRDRRVAALGALERHGPSLVVDCGTAVTLTHVDHRLRLRGLAIAPGLGTLATAFAAAAPALAAFIETRASPPVGLPRGTADNLGVGLDEGWQGMLQALIAGAQRRLAAEAPPVDRGGLLFTGTDGLRALRAVGRGTLALQLLHAGLYVLLTGARGHA